MNKTAAVILLYKQKNWHFEVYLRDYISKKGNAQIVFLNLPDQEWDKQIKKNYISGGEKAATNDTMKMGRSDKEESTIKGR